MAIVRLSILFHHVSGTTALANAAPVRTAGWSENFYYDSTGVTDAIINAMQVARAALLPTQAAIIGQRFQFEDGSTRTATRRYSGTTGESVDIPQMGLLASSRNLGFQSTRHFIIRGIPDAWVVAGELVDNAAIQLALRNYFTQLANGFRWKARNKAATQVDITRIDNNGNAIVAPGWPITTDDRVRMVRVVNTVGQSITGTYRLLAVTDSTHFQIANWGDNLTVANRGRLQLVSFNYPPFLPGQTQVSRVAPKKVGRSFFQARGRVSARRR